MKPVRDIVCLPAAPLGSFCDVRVPTVGLLRDKTHITDWTFTQCSLNIILKGRGNFRQPPGPVHPVRACCFFVVRPGVRYLYGPENGAAWTECFVKFTGTGVRRWIESGLLPDEPRVWQFENSPPIRAVLREMMRVIKRGGAGDSDRVTVLAEKLLVELHIASRSYRNRNQPRGVGRVLEWCREHLSGRMDFRQLAERYGMSYSALRQGIKRNTGMSPVRYINHLRCEAAKTLLNESDMTIKEVGAAVGFRHPVTFSLTFRRYVPMSPREYRSETRPEKIKTAPRKRRRVRPGCARSDFAAHDCARWPR